MPIIVRVLADARWLPWPESLRDGNFPQSTPPDMSRQFLATKVLMEDELPKIVATVMSHINDYHVDEADIRVEVSHFHPWGYNNSDLSISIHAGIERHRLSEDLHRSRQAHVIELVSEGLLEYFRAIKLMPDFDVECATLTSSGTSYFNGVIVSEWGAPSAVNR